MSDRSVRIDLLGSFRVVVGGRPVPGDEWRRRHAAHLVKLLALAPARRMHRERVLAGLWPELSLAAAAPRLHKAAHYARRAVGTADAVVLAGDVVTLLPGTPVECDCERFEQLAGSALSTQDAAVAARAADAYPGDLLPDDLYEPWSQEPRERLRLLYLDVLRLARRWDLLAAADPADEQAHLAVARRLADEGDRLGALRQFERLEHALRQELGVGLSAEAAGFRASLAAGDPRVAPRDGALLGRDDELTWLSRALDSVADGRNPVVFLSGRAGMGKTSLLTALEREASARGMRVGSGLGARIDGAWPYAPVLEALAELSRRHPDLLAGMEDGMRVELRNALAGRPAGWDGRGSHQRLFVASAELLRLAGADRGAVLAIDDAHDADDASLRLLHFLARATMTDRVLIVLAHRPVNGGVLADVRSGLRGRARAACVELKPLRRRDAMALARRHAPSAPPATVQAVAFASGGVPYAIIDRARSVALDPTAPPGRVLLPAALSEQAQRTLATVAVLGSSFDTDEFVELTGLGDDDAFAMLQAASAADLIERTDTGFAFAHAVQREALLEGCLTGDQRRAAHLAAAGALERLGRSPKRVGGHLHQAGRAADAVPWLLQAAETEAALGAYREALASLELARPAATGEQATRLLALRADLLSACGDRTALDAYRAALAAARRPEQRVRLRTQLARTATQQGDLETAVLAIEGIEPDGTHNDGDLLVTRGHLAMWRGDFAAAGEAATEAQRRLVLHEQPDGRLFHLVTLQAMLAHYRGEWFQRLRAELRTGAQRPELAAGLFDSHLCVAEFLLYGPTPYDEVLALADELRRTAERAGVPRAVAFAVALRGEAALLKGDLDLAESELADAADLHHSLEFPGGEAHSLQRLAEVHLQRGDRAAALPLLRRALLLARWALFGRCLLPRIYGTMIDAAQDADEAMAVVERAEATLAPDERCPFCGIMLAVPAARAFAFAGEPAEARRWLGLAEAAEARWEGTSWEASLLEARGVLARAEGDEARAGRLLLSAANRFDGSGQPLDAARCRALANDQ